MLFPLLKKHLKWTSSHTMLPDRWPLENMFQSKACLVTWKPLGALVWPWRLSDWTDHTTSDCHGRKTASGKRSGSHCAVSARQFRHASLTARTNREPQGWMPSYFDVTLQLLCLGDTVKKKKSCWLPSTVSLTFFLFHVCLFFNFVALRL